MSALPLYKLKAHRHRDYPLYLFSFTYFLIAGTLFFILFDVILLTHRKQIPVPTILTEMQAIQVVSNIPVVQTYVSQNPITRKVTILPIQSDQSMWIVRVYEEKPDTIETLNWYYVDKKTGGVITFLNEPPSTP